MKKILSLFVIVFILLQNISFAEFNIETKLSAQKQESYKKQVDTVYKGFENKISKFNEEKQISNIEKVVWKIEIILKNKLSDKNNFVLSYLNYLLKEKLDFLKNNDESINLWEVLKVEDEKIIKTENKITIIEEKKTPKIESEIKTCYGDNWIWEEKITLIDWVKQTSPWCKFIKCNEWYENKNWVCIKKEVQKICNQNEHIENNSCVSNFRSCNVDNWIWQQQYLWNFWTECSFIKCNDWYDNINWACIKKQVQITCNQNEHIENNSCVSNIKSCNIDNWVWEQNWNWSNWSKCILSLNEQIKLSGCDNLTKIWWKEFCATNSKLNKFWFSISHNIDDSSWWIWEYDNQYIYSNNMINSACPDGFKVPSSKDMVQVLNNIWCNYIFNWNWFPLIDKLQNSQWEINKCFENTQNSFWDNYFYEIRSSSEKVDIYKSSTIRLSDKFNNRTNYNFSYGLSSYKWNEGEKDISRFDTLFTTWLSVRCIKE